MKKLLLLIALLATASAALASGVEAATAAREVITRTFGRCPANIEFVTTDKPASGCDSYTLQADRGVLRIEGSSTVALCKAFHDYIVENGYGVANWSGNRLEVPKKFPNMARRSVTSPFRDHLYYNVCTFGYTTPFWGWEEWQCEIDWMALHGFDMPLAPIAGEAILARVWRSMGLTQAEIDAYFTGPAHMPWMRMGNMTGLDGAPSAKWHKAQITLQHQIIERMQLLGMTPVYQGFAGFVPEGMKRLYPDMELTKTKWAGFTDYLLSPLDKRFAQIGTEFIRAWEKEFGKGKYYLIDSFNEMDIPFGEHLSDERAQTLRNYSSTIYRSLSEANPDAVWVMQGWMFGYQRNIWDPFSVEALLSGVPDGKLYIVDLAVDFNNYVWRSEKSWNHFPKLYGKEWIFSTVPNFGGRSALTGVLEFYANGHLEALASPNKGALTGFGTSPEGIENNDVVYELIAAAGWSNQKIDVAQFLHNYSKARYGSCPEAIDRFWGEMRQSAYNEFTNNARHRWQRRPYTHRRAAMNINDHYFTAVESFLSCAGKMGNSENYRTDAIQYTAFYLAAKADILLEAINWAYLTGDNARAAELEKRFIEVLTNADRLLATHPILRLDRWSEKARKAAATQQEKERFVRESRRLVSTWGGPSLADYSARIWSGVIRDFYIPRWQLFFAAKRSGSNFSFEEWDEFWFEKTQISPVTPFAYPIEQAQKLVAEAAQITEEIIGSPDGCVSCWSPFEMTHQNPTHSFSISYEQFDQLRGFRLTHLRGGDEVKIKKIYITASGHRWVDQTLGLSVGEGRGEIDITLTKLEVKAPRAKEFVVNFVFECEKGAESFAAVELIDDSCTPAK